MKTVIATFIAAAIGISAMAQATGTIMPTEKKDYVYRQAYQPVGIDNCSFSSYYYNARRVFNLRSFQVCEGPGEIQQMKINPSGAAVAIRTARKGGNKTDLAIYSLFTADKLIRNIKTEYKPTAIAYSPDARRFAAAGDDNKLHVYDARAYKEELKTYDLPMKPSQLAISSNNYFYAVSDGERLEIYNFETGALRKSIPVSNKVNYFTFSPDNASLAVLTNDGILTLYDTRTFLPVQEFARMGEAISCDMHIDGKYIAVATAGNRITIVNKYEPEDRQFIECIGNGVNNVKFVYDAKERVFLLYSTENSIVYALQTTLKPNFNLLLNDEVNDKMNAWMKQMPGESLEEYYARVNDQTRMEQRYLFETEIATRMADNLLSASTVTLGDFNMSTNTLALNFDTMPTIYLDIPRNDAAMLTSADDLEFSNAKYGIMNDDHFELVYADILNKKTNSTYVYDKRSRKSLEFAHMDDEIVPLELVQRSNMEEMRLMEIREAVMEEAKTQNIVSDHTHIAVKTEITPDVDANGNKIMNYGVGFSYDVEAGFSAQEDFAAGKYHTKESGAASSMVKIIRQAFEGEFAQYVKAGKKVRITVTGMADNLKIHGKIGYDGAYGEFIDEPVYNGNELTALTVTKQSGITQNEQLAFMRAAGVQQSIREGVPALSEMNAYYEYRIQLLDQAGGEFRRISVDFTFIDAF